MASPNCARQSQPSFPSTHYEQGFAKAVGVGWVVVAGCKQNQQRPATTSQQMLHMQGDACLAPQFSLCCGRGVEAGGGQRNNLNARQIPYVMPSRVMKPTPLSSSSMVLQASPHPHLKHLTSPDEVTSVHMPTYR